MRLCTVPLQRPLQQLPSCFYAQYRCSAHCSCCTSASRWCNLACVGGSVLFNELQFKNRTSVTVVFGDCMACAVSTPCHDGLGSPISEDGKWAWLTKPEC
eukprot:jgi/Ulvmu1/11495/UM077_0044.1